MSTESARKVVSRAVTDEEFRNLLFSNPDKAPLWMPLVRASVPVVAAELGNLAGSVGAAIAAAHGIECEGRVRPF